MTRWILVVALGAACASQRPTGPSSRPALEEDRGPAYEIARQVALAAGVAQLSSVAQIDFRFVVVDAEGTRVFEAAHAWDLAGQRARITWTRETKKYDAVLDISTKRATGTIDGAPATGEQETSLSEQAYARWINDTYWLMLPLKLFDPGTSLELLPSRTVGGEAHHVIRITFDAVGLTPGDSYVLIVNSAARRIVRWEMQLEGQEAAPPRGVSWIDYRPVGPLVLAHDHVSDGSGRRVRFEGTAAKSAVDESRFNPP